MREERVMVLVLMLMLWEEEEVAGGSRVRILSAEDHTRSALQEHWRLAEKADGRGLTRWLELRQAIAST